MAVLIVPASADARYASRTLAEGSQGSDVKKLQKYLKRAGFTTQVTGYYGSQTAGAQRSFEKSVDRRANGRASVREQRLLRRTAKRDASEAGNGGREYDENYDPPADNPSSRARISSDGRTAIAPDNAPAKVKAAIEAANEITSKPYKYGGGHGKWQDSGYDCSGAVSYALHGGDLLGRSRDSTGFMSWGKAGKGDWITVYANSGHAYVVIAGLRFDTSAAGAGGGEGPRWRNKWRSPSGYVARHPGGY
jgi:hypothetical protein